MFLWNSNMCANSVTRCLLGKFFKIINTKTPKGTTCKSCKIVFRIKILKIKKEISNKTTRNQTIINITNNINVIVPPKDINKLL